MPIEITVILTFILASRSGDIRDYEAQIEKLEKQLADAQKANVELMQEMMNEEEPKKDPRLQQIEKDRDAWKDKYHEAMATIELELSHSPRLERSQQTSPISSPNLKVSSTHFPNENNDNLSLTVELNELKDKFNKLSAELADKKETVLQYQLEEQLAANEISVLKGSIIIHSNGYHNILFRKTRRC